MMESNIPLNNLKKKYLKISWKITGTSNTNYLVNKPCRKLHPLWWYQQARTWKKTVDGVSILAQKMTHCLAHNLHRFAKKTWAELCWWKAHCLSQESASKGSSATAQATWNGRATTTLSNHHSLGVHISSTIFAIFCYIKNNIALSKAWNALLACHGTYSSVLNNKYNWMLVFINNSLFQTLDSWILTELKCNVEK